MQNANNPSTPKEMGFFSSSSIEEKEKKMEAPCHTFKLHITSAPFCLPKQIPKMASLSISIELFEQTTPFHYCKCKIYCITYYFKENYII